MRPHRFAVNLGYGFDANDSGMTSEAMIFTSMFIELGLEVAVDSAAVPIEHAHGIDLDRFWDMWRANPGNFFGLHVSSSLVAISITLWSFSTLPSPFFCTSQHDPCSCTGGVFTIFKAFCDASSSDTASNSNSSTNNTTSTAASNTTLGSIATAAKTAYVGIFESLEGSSTVVLVSIAVVVVVSLVFYSARSQLMASAAEREREEVEIQRLELLETNERIQEENERIKKELKSAQLDNDQLAMVKANAGDIESNVPAHLKLDWKQLKFLKRLGGGSFGDCFHGTKGERDVAIKRMRVALTDKKGFQAFCKEVVTLSNLDNINIVRLVGYVLEPCLLIVMDYVSGGTLSEFIKGQDPTNPPSMQMMMKILVGSVKGMVYLHAMEPLPILHRDIKSDNILLTDQLEPRIADLGEARTMAKDKAMTIVGLACFPFVSFYVAGLL